MGPRERENRAYVCRLFAGESCAPRAREAGCSWIVGKRDECKADRRRGTKYETNSWNDGEERARERARGKQLDRVASNAARRGAETDAAARRIERENEKEMGEDRKR